MRYITNVVSDEYGRIMRWDDLPKYDESGQAIDYSNDETAVYIPDEAEETFDTYCGKKSKVIEGAVVTDMTLPVWKSTIVLRNEQKMTLTDIELALCDIYEMLGGTDNG
ncbi:MAG: hypothetical protein IJS94_05275 [Clostridia bacterium]|nr:hypothetical protein [Clostridia bacterium]